MGQARARAVVLDAGALVAIERADARMLALLVRGLAAATFIVPATVLAQVWRDGARQARLSKFLCSRQVEVVAFDEAMAKASGALCRLAGTSDPTDASVAVLARERRAIVVTSDPSDISRLDASLELHSL